MRLVASNFIVLSQPVRAMLRIHSRVSIIKFIKSYIPENTHKKTPKGCEYNIKLYSMREYVAMYSQQNGRNGVCRNRELTTETGSIQRDVWWGGLLCCVRCELYRLIANIPRAVYDVRFGLYMHTLAIDWFRLAVRYIHKGTTAGQV